MKTPVHQNTGLGATDTEIIDALRDEIADCNAAYASQMLEISALKATRDALRAALKEIAELAPRPFTGEPKDWQQQIDGCEDCRRYKGHPIQQGICDKHRQPIWARDEHERHERRMIGDRAKDIARAALRALQSKDGAA